MFPHLRRLDFADVPKSFRTHIIDSFPIFTNIRILIIGVGSGKWMFKSIANNIAQGMRNMKHIEHFSLKHDCTLGILKVLSDNCRETLRILDVENAKGVGDEAFEFIAAMKNIQDLNIFNTKLTDEYKAKLLMRLPNLRVLRRGDFLCDALGWVDYLEEMDTPVFQIKEFFPSQQYYFHEDWQVETVHRMCPFIEKMLFIFHEQYVPSYLVLAPFEHIQDLELYGGGFFTDKINSLLELRGKRLKKLSLISVKQIDYRAISVISVTCPALTGLAMHNCQFVEFRLMLHS